jgi:hypothetical protein
MKKIILPLASILTASLFALPASAQLKDINIVTVAFRLQLQSPGFNSQNGTVRNFAKPVIQTITTKNLLDRLALDKQAQGQYNSSQFPGGSKLAVADGKFVVVKSNNDLIVDVSDIVKFESGTNDILAGTTNNLTGLADNNTVELLITRLKFDDTFITGGSDLSFYAQGLDTVRTQDSTPNNNGKYNEITSDKVDKAAGEGQSGGVPFVLTGTIQGSLRTSLTLSPPAS